jgi:hypothetical protein
MWTASDFEDASMKEAANRGGLASLLSENPGMENGRDLQDRAGPVANLYRETLVNQAFRDGLAGSIDKGAERHGVRLFGVWQLEAILVGRKGLARPEVEKILSHSRAYFRGLTSVAGGLTNLPIRRGEML